MSVVVACRAGFGLDALPKTVRADGPVAPASLPVTAGIGEEAVIGVGEREQGARTPTLLDCAGKGTGGSDPERGRERERGREPQGVSEGVSE